MKRQDKWTGNKSFKNNIDSNSSKKNNIPRYESNKICAGSIYFKKHTIKKKQGRPKYWSDTL